MSSPTSTWQDRRGMFQSGKEVHEPGKPVTRRESGSGIADAVRRASTASIDALEKTTSSSSASPSSQRRSSNTGGLFGNLTQHKRGSEDYGERRNSHAEQRPAGMMSGWYNSTFRGMTGAKQPSTETTQNQKRGVME
ncbi:hypothetical protein LTR36_005800 [Oleoguttula mirabilis]|uniref:Uncharacterized protein n=1 Tax=Oleoguttula mirabilis TaxID=1507867 RepID=A0AAV9JD99_9PEZI|nr:hypothetical protein LTR36_005800 [Oleoguttula mirabilis]